MTRRESPGVTRLRALNAGPRLPESRSRGARAVLKAIRTVPAREQARKSVPAEQGELGF